MAKSDSYMPFFYDWIAPLDSLTGDEFKDLVLAMVRYHKDGSEPPRFEGSTNMAACFVFPQLARAKEVSKARAEAGRKGGQAEREQANASKKEQTETTNTNTNTSTNTSTNTKSLSRFAEFWAAYPKKVGKQNAQKAWDKLDPDDKLFDIILSAVESQKRSAQWCKENGQYIPNPSTWINQRRWEDELSPAQTRIRDVGSFETDDFFNAALDRSLRQYSEEVAANEIGFEGSEA